MDPSRLLEMRGSALLAAATEHGRLVFLASAAAGDDATQVSAAFQPLALARSSLGNSAAARFRPLTSRPAPHVSRDRSVGEITCHAPPASSPSIVTMPSATSARARAMPRTGERGDRLIGGHPTSNTRSPARRPSPAGARPRSALALPSVGRRVRRRHQRRRPRTSRATLLPAERERQSRRSPSISRCQGRIGSPP